MPSEAARRWESRPVPYTVTLGSVMCRPLHEMSCANEEIKLRCTARHAKASKQTQTPSCRQSYISLPGEGKKGGILSIATVCADTTTISLPDSKAHGISPGPRIGIRVPKSRLLVCLPSVVILSVLLRGVVHRRRAGAVG